MKKALTIIFTILLFKSAIAQTDEVVRLKKVLTDHPAQDTFRVNRLNDLGLEARKSTTQDSYNALTEALSLSRKLKYKHGEAIALIGLGFYYRFSGDPKQGVKFTLDALHLAEELRDTNSIITCSYNLSISYIAIANFENGFKYAFDGLRLAQLSSNSKWNILMTYQLGNLYMRLKEYERGKFYFQRSLSMATAANDLDGIAHAVDGIIWVYEQKEQWDSALFYEQKNLDISKKLNDLRSELAIKLGILGIKERQGKHAEVFQQIYSLRDAFTALGQAGYLPGVYGILAQAHLKTGNADSSLFYAFKILNASQRSGRVMSSGGSSKLIADAYAQKKNFEQAYKYQRMFSDYTDSINLNDAIKRSAAFQYTEELEKKESEITLLKKNEELTAKENRQQKMMLVGAALGFVILMIFSFILWKNNKERKRAYKRLELQQKQLKETQAQLIQSEKMASLGELTAGIAHEIQNPLNFINNFSDVNKELIQELKEEIDKGNIEDVKTIADDISENETKINHHGKRADAIVKSMLQHSRKSTGQKELTDINALVDEYLRLSYHGLRAKDKSFNAILETHFDPAVDKASVVGQDIGRVLLNLFNNAFYAVNAKKNSSTSSEGQPYEPTVQVITTKTSKGIEIKVKDNGTGIPEKVLEKIYQPFFTTKPTGEGTGLGLSLSYDIITKGHGGEMKVETKEGEGSKFIIALPANN